MPHVEIKCFPGRTEEQKRMCAGRVAEDVAEILGCSLGSVSVSIKEVEPGNWKRDVYEKSIVPDKYYLYKEPGYDCD